MVERDFPTEVEKDATNKFAWERVHQYQKLKIANLEVSTPFYSNDVALHFKRVMSDVGISNGDIVNVFSVYNNNQVPYGWFRGKGDPEQITSAAKEIADLWGLDLKRATNPEVITEFMKAAGLGIDCSGFVYQTLKYAFEKTGHTKLLNETLEWPDSVRQENVYNAGIRNFTDGASTVIQPSEVQPTDIITIETAMGEKYSHMALILKESNRLKVAQSAIGQIPTGVNISVLEIKDGLPKFDFRPNLTDRWENLYETRKLEFRRLNIFK